MAGLFSNLFAASEESPASGLGSGDVGESLLADDEGEHAQDRQSGGSEGSADSGDGRQEEASGGADSRSTEADTGTAVEAGADVEFGIAASNELTVEYQDADGNSQEYSNSTEAEFSQQAGADAAVGTGSGGELTTDF